MCGFYFCSFSPPFSLLAVFRDLSFNAQAGSLWPNVHESWTFPRLEGNRFVRPSVGCSPSLLLPRHSLILLLFRRQRPVSSIPCPISRPLAARDCGRRNSEFSVVCMRVTDYTRARIIHSGHHLAAKELYTFSGVKFYCQP